MMLPLTGILINLNAAMLTATKTFESTVPRLENFVQVHLLPLSKGLGKKKEIGVINCHEKVRS